jgi:hypothetical protein
MNSFKVGGMLSAVTFCLLLEQCQTQNSPAQKYISVGQKYPYSDTRTPSPAPPSGIAWDKTPQFVAIGFDDNGFSGMEGSKTKGGLRFVLDCAKNKKNPLGKGNAKTFDHAPVHFSFYVAGNFLGWPQVDSPAFIAKALREAFLAGHELGNHTYSHEHGTKFTVDHWEAEIDECTKWLVKPFNPDNDPENPDIRNGAGISNSQIFGFRTPYLEYSDSTLTALTNLGFLYDCSIEEGWQDNQDGTNFLWPYTLDNGSPGNVKTTHDTLTPLAAGHKGLWEMPCYAVIIPPDDKCKEYNVAPGLRNKLAKAHNYFKAGDGKITGLDWNLWVDFQLSKAEFLAALKYSFDLRLTGNKCPFLFGAHSDIYSDSYPDTIANATPQERRDALLEFLNYALSKPAVRIASMKELLDWLRNPIALE